MKIAYFTDTLYPQVNGVSNTLAYLTKYLKQTHTQFMIFAPEFDPCAEEDAIIRFKGYRPHFYPECSLAIPNYRTVRNKILVFAPDIIHIVTEFGMGLCGLRIARELNIPIVMSYHTNFDKLLYDYKIKYLQRPYWAYMKWFHGFAEVNLCPSNDTLNALNEKGIAKLDLWTRGIDLNDFNPMHYSDAFRNGIGAGNKMIFLYVGRIAKEKGLDTYMKAIKLFNKKYSDHAIFVFTGDGPYKEELMQSEIPNIRFTGLKRKKELASVYASSDVFVFPSGCETFGNVLLEAMASGLPCICTDKGGVTDFTKHLENAFVFKFSNYRSLNRALRKMLMMTKMRDHIKDEGIKTASRRSWDQVFAELFLKYDQVKTKNSKVEKTIAS